MWMGSGSLSTSGFVNWYTVVEPSFIPPADSLGRHRSDETVETERLRDIPIYTACRRFQHGFGHYDRTDRF